MKGIKWLALVGAVCLLLIPGCSPGGKGPAVSTADTTASAVSTQETEPETTGTVDGSEADTTDSEPSEGTATKERPSATKKPMAMNNPATTSAVTTRSVTTPQSAPQTTPRTTPQTTLDGPKGESQMDNLTYDNAGRFMGDNDGPAYVVYSQKGYNRASMNILLGDAQVQIHRKSDERFIVAYAFLGMDIHDGETGQWRNCLDAGLRYCETEKWHLFYNLYDATADQARWYESRINLDPTHTYRLTLDASQNNGWATLTAYDLTVNKEADSVLLQARYAKKDGSNVSFYQDYALDFPVGVKLTTQGVPSENDWEEITLYNTDEGMYLKNLRIVGVTLNDQPWTAEQTDRRTLWPDCHNVKIDYPVVRISHASFDTEMQIDLDMNR